MANSDAAFFTSFCCTTISFAAFFFGEALSLLSRSKNHPALTLIRDRSALKDRPIPYDFYHLYAFSYFFIKIEALWPPNPSELLIA